MERLFLIGRFGFDSYSHQIKSFVDIRSFLTRRSALKGNIENKQASIFVVPLGEGISPTLIGLQMTGNS